MKYLLLSLLVLLSIASCTDEDAPKDTETNRYYANYLKIYNAYDSLGNEATLQALNAYLEEFPERPDAYIFKGYIVSKMGRYSEGQQYFEYAKSLDSANVQSYEFQSAFLLYDTTKQTETRTLILQGIAIDDSSAVLMNNLAWLNILEGNSLRALENISAGISFDDVNKNLYRTGYVAALLANDESFTNMFKEKLISLEIGDPSKIETQLSLEGPFNFLKSLE